jgi:hypothetical protein
VNGDHGVQPAAGVVTGHDLFVFFAKPVEELHGAVSLPMEQGAGVGTSTFRVTSYSTAQI